MTMTSAPAAERQADPAVPRTQWTVAEAVELFEQPFMDLLFRAQQVHRAHFDANAVQRSTLLSIKTGGCSEDCGYCSQSTRHNTGLDREQLLKVAEVVEHAKAAKAKGASRFCMGAAWRGPKDKDMETVLAMVREVKALGLETCVTLGMLKGDQALQLKEAGLDYYNHNLDTAPEFYGQVITTHTLADRLDTLEQVRGAGINVCSGGIVGMGEGRRSRAGLLVQLANMASPPESVPINNLVPVPGTPLENVDKIDPFEFVRTIAAARIMMPTSFVRLSAGRQQMSDELQALCFMAGANSIFYGDRLLTTDNPDTDRDEALFARLGLRPV
ncbi:biotin synthase BioB [Aromatoleum bremense]|uniref:Biotin synthase n=1 Tax=Aromatoleum bremense TaxID=76115 RepID=A0ABX1NRY2_9RHOO|nr:biotin synthase BioB [Aromatoleum bremense]NMG14758.1 biotin synthase BioB [Aromatoleum bremense]QTQ30969.1 Biotin synthase [Aromatoleum bremense]